MAQSASKQSSYEIGMQAENAATFFLKQKGYIILHRRYKTPYGEIDLICQQDDAIIMVEVKHRKYKGDCLDLISNHQKKRIHDAALHFLASTPEFENKNIRFDVILSLPKEALTHIENVWCLDNDYN